MRCIISNSNSPYFNLATEEYFLKNSQEELFLMYINSPCIVVGKHQNLLSEINLPFVREQNIKLARRISGGGTVYQDFDNINFSFIHNCSNREQINFARYTSPVLEALRDIGLEAIFSQRNDLLVEGKKISGNAMHIFKNRVLSHGTLLFDTNLKNLSESLKDHSQRYQDKSIKSVRSKVANISQFLTNYKSVHHFEQSLFQLIKSREKLSYIKPPDDHEEKSIRILAEEKFESWEWIYGYSPKYTFNNSIEISGRSIKFSLNVEKGIIRSIQMDHEIPAYNYAFGLLDNTRHDYNSIVKLLSDSDLFALYPEFDLTFFCNYLF